MTKYRIALVGGGRWARVYAGVLSKLPDLVGSVTVVSPRNADGMRQWLATQKLPHDVLEVLDPAGFDAAIIVNAPADHEFSAMRFLAAGVPVLVEKPLALNAASAARMIEAAKARGACLAAALVFRFAAYVERFAAALPAAWDSLVLTWTDPAVENRYGERKVNDPRVPLLADVLPHVVSILDTLAPGAEIAYRSAAPNDGGAQTDLDLTLNGRPCLVHLARNAVQRVRLVQVVAGAGRYELDFSDEPGRITIGGAHDSGDPDWGNRPSPLTQMARRFLEGISGAPDRRLDPQFALHTCELTDAALRRS